MDDIPGSTKTEDTERHGLCPFCLARTDVHLDIKGRPYWRCWRCEVRSFGTKTSLRTLEGDGWIWSGGASLEAFHTLLRRIITAAQYELDEGDNSQRSRSGQRT